MLRPIHTTDPTVRGSIGHPVAGDAEATSADTVIATLGLVPHREGGFDRETGRDAPADGSRGSGSTIYFLLRAGDDSAWHRHDAAEVWHFHAGAPLDLLACDDPPGKAGPAASVDRFVLGPDLGRGERPQAVVEPYRWQAARTRGPWTLVGCTVSPAFSFETFELAPDPTGVPPGPDHRQSPTDRDPA
jgi:uncharacterized protein